MPKYLVAVPLSSTLQQHYSHSLKHKTTIEHM